jgi:hypothetical protein
LVATHSDADAHEIPSRFPSLIVALDHCGWLSPGSVDHSTLPCAVTARQRLSVTQSTPRTMSVGAMTAAFHAPASGSVDVTSSPSAPPATHSSEAVQEIA